MVLLCSFLCSQRCTFAFSGIRLFFEIDSVRFQKQARARVEFEKVLVEDARTDCLRQIMQTVISESAFSVF